MEKEWESILFHVIPYKETETFILKSPDEASQLLDDHIVMTQSMSFSPFKKPFEDRINTWENKLKMTQVLIYWCIGVLVHLLCKVLPGKAVPIRCYDGEGKEKFKWKGKPSCKT